MQAHFKDNYLWHMNALKYKNYMRNITRAISKAIIQIKTLVGNRIYLRCFTSLIRSWTFIIHRRRFSHVKMDSIFSINFREFKKVAEVVKIWAAGLILLLLSTPAEAVNSSVNMRFFPAGEEKISQRKSVWLLAFGKRAKPFEKSLYNYIISSMSQSNGSYLDHKVLQCIVQI